MIPGSVHFNVSYVVFEKSVTLSSVILTLNKLSYDTLKWVTASLNILTFSQVALIVKALNYVTFSYVTFRCVIFD